MLGSAQGELKPKGRRRVHFRSIGVVETRATTGMSPETDAPAAGRTVLPSEEGVDRVELAYAEQLLDRIGAMLNGS